MQENPYDTIVMQEPITSFSVFIELSEDWVTEFRDEIFFEGYAIETLTINTFSFSY